MNCGPVRLQPLEQRPAVVERDADGRVALERGDHRLVGRVVGLGDDPSEVADRLVVVEGERERDPRPHRGPRQPRSVTSVRAAPLPGSPAASSAGGRYRDSVYSWSIRVVEKRHSALDIARRMTVSQRGGKPAGSRS